MPSANPPGRPCLGLPGTPCKRLTSKGSRCPPCTTAYARLRESRKSAQRKATGQRTGSTRAWRLTRAAVLKRDGWRCTHIGQRYGRPYRCPVTRDLHVDHIEPRSRGGSDSMDNLRTLCAAHNLQKGDR